MTCKREGCNNRGRYDSGYCGICDITENGGKGRPRKLGACTRCSTVFGERPYASIPGVGVLCLGCRTWWLNERDQELG